MDIHDQKHKAEKQPQTREAKSKDEQRNIHLNPHLIPYIKIDAKWVMGLNVKHKNIKLLEKTMRKISGSGTNYLTRHQKHNSYKENLIN